MGPIRILILDDLIETHIPGRTPNTVDEAAMRASVHVVRNPHTYPHLSDAGLVTRAGSGIRRIIRLIKRATGSDIGIDIRDSVKKQPDAPGRTVGIRKMARSYRYAEQIGEFVCTSPYEAVGAKIQWTKKISQRKVPTDSDEAIVSHDLG